MANANSEEERMLSKTRGILLRISQPSRRLAVRSAGWGMQLELPCESNSQIVLVPLHPELQLQCADLFVRLSQIRFRTVVIAFVSVGY